MTSIMAAVPGCVISKPMPGLTVGGDVIKNFAKSFRVDRILILPGGFQPFLFRYRHHQIYRSSLHLCGANFDVLIFVGEL